MPRFCVKCGAAIASEDIRFCLQCGTPVGAPPGAPGPPPAMPPSAGSISTPATAAPVAASAKSGSPVLKILLIILAIIFLIVVIAIGSCVYIGYRVKKKANELKQTYNIESLGSQGSEKAIPERDVCTLVTKEEVAEALGSPISESSGGTSGCQYQVAGGGNRVLSVQVTWQGGTLAMKLSTLALKGAGAGTGVAVMHSIHGLGDEAIVMPMGAGLMFRKGDVLVNIDLRGVQNNVEAGKAIAQKIADRL